MDVPSRTFLIPEDRLEAAQKAVRSLLQRSKAAARWVSKRALARVIGGLQSLCLALHYGRFLLSALYSCLNSVEGWDKATRVKLSHDAIRQLEIYWLELEPVDMGRKWGPPEQ